MKKKEKELMARFPAPFYSHFPYRNYPLYYNRHYNSYNKYYHSVSNPVSSNVNTEHTNTNDSTTNNTSSDKTIYESRNTDKKEKNFDNNSFLFEFFGIKIFSDDILILSLLYFLYIEGIKDDGLFIALLLLLIN